MRDGDDGDDDDERTFLLPRRRANGGRRKGIDEKAIKFFRFPFLDLKCESPALPRLPIGLFRAAKSVNSFFVLFLNISSNFRRICVFFSAGHRRKMERTASALKENIYLYIIITSRQSPSNGESAPHFRTDDLINTAMPPFSTYCETATTRHVAACTANGTHGQW